MRDWGPGGRNYSEPVRGIAGGNPSFTADDGSADPAVSRALAAYAACQGSERAALAALTAGRLLVPVVAVARGEPPAPGTDLPVRPDLEHAGGGNGREGARAGLGDKSSEMALPTLIGLDGRRAIPAFTCLDAMRRWRQDARPVPARALDVWQAAAGDSCAVIIDVGGPVPLAVEGARLAALSRGEPPPEAWADADVREAVASALSGELEVSAFGLHPGGDEGSEVDEDLVVELHLVPGRAAADVSELAARVAGAVLDQLGGRLRRGVAIWLGTGR